jgi:hypothetical protein
LLSLEDYPENGIDVQGRECQVGLRFTRCPASKDGLAVDDVV